MPRIGFLLIAIVFVAAACGGQEEAASFPRGRPAPAPAMPTAAAPPLPAPAAKAAPAPRFVERLVQSEAVKAVSVETEGS